jgi:hypothetical protein
MKRFMSIKGMSGRLDEKLKCILSAKKIKGRQINRPVTAEISLNWRHAVT